MVVYLTFIFLTNYSNEMKGFFYLFIRKAHNNLRPLKRLSLYKYTKGFEETPPSRKANKGSWQSPPTFQIYSIYIYQRLTVDTTFMGCYYIFYPECLLDIFLPIAHNNLYPLRRYTYQRLTISIRSAIFIMKVYRRLHPL